MVFKPLSHLARRSTKAFAHHAQSITAASSTTTTQHFDKYTHRHRFVKRGNVQQRDSFHTSALQQPNSAKPVLDSPAFDQGSDNGLDAYFAAWQRVQHGDEWHQFQFRRRIGWKNTASDVDSLRSSDRDEAPCLETDQRPLLNRAHSTSALEGIKKSQDSAIDHIEAAHLAQVDKAVANEIKDIEHEFQETAAISTISGRSGHDGKANGLVEGSSQIPSDKADHQSSGQIQPSNDVPAFLAKTSDENYHSNHMDTLERTDSYSKIPAAFEALLRGGSVPTVEAYNALISAAICLPAHDYQVVSKVLDVYSDMLRRKVSPNIRTYTLLLDSLCVRSLQVKEARNLLEQNQLRYGGMKTGATYMFHSHESEAEILAEDGSLSIALKLFAMAAKESAGLVMSSGTYRVLIEACAAYGDVESMIQVHTHMESNKVIPYASIYPAMIRAFANAGELQNAIECYEGYKSMAVSDDSGVLALLDRVDNDVYAAVVKGYLVCGRQLGADKFFSKLEDTPAANDVQKTRLHSARDAVALNAYTSRYLELRDFEKALQLVGSTALSYPAKNDILNRICIEAADRNTSNVASQSYARIPDKCVTLAASEAMLAMYVRQGNVAAAREIYSTSLTNNVLLRTSIEPSTMYAMALCGGGFVDEGIMEARKAYGDIRSFSQNPNDKGDLAESIDMAIEALSSFLKDRGIISSAQASMNLMWAMIDNGGLIPSVAEQLLSGLGPNEVALLSWQDLKLALQVEAGILGNGKPRFDVAHSARFAYLLDTALVNRMPLDKRTSDLVESALDTIGNGRPDLLARWRGQLSSPNLSPMIPSDFLPASPGSILSSGSDGNIDPYASTLDHRGSSIIVEELERQGRNTPASLSEALARLRNIRRSGRHPRYIAYSKLIASAAKEGRTSLVHDLVGTAKQDMPLLLQYPTVRHGWASILDAMVGACLTLGNRRLAFEYHQQLRGIGCAPTANTFGLYITTLKESTRTFDEASEAVKIFHQARSEGVEPSSFLYNALIGKLGKARRIDDCLYYFAEMRSRSIRPTSVTYGTIVNALCRVSDERFAQELFDEMEAMPNYKPRPAPYNSLMQFFLTTKRDSSKVLEYYQRMQTRNIRPTMHTYKLLIDTYATLEPINLAAAEGVLQSIRASGQTPEAVHYASLIHAKGCVLHDMQGAREIFDRVIADLNTRPQACLYQALFESMVANHCVGDTKPVLLDMASRGIGMTPYIANCLIHGWALEDDISMARAVYEGIGTDKREPSTYEAMTRAFLSSNDRDNALEVVQEMLSRGYPSAVSGKIFELLGH
ncbi:MAG: hypothetical protein MMC23_009358, partial [Stictis urceolatum]|nr:hypothetical protein [Stictis urceolata]